MRKGTNRMVLIWLSSQNFDVFVLQIIEGLNGFSIFASEVLKVQQFQDPERIIKINLLKLEGKGIVDCCYSFCAMEQMYGC